MVNHISSPLMEPYRPLYFTKQWIGTTQVQQLQYKKWKDSLLYYFFQCCFFNFIQQNDFFGNQINLSRENNVVKLTGKLQEEQKP